MKLKFLMRMLLLVPICTVVNANTTDNISILEVQSSVSGQVTDDSGLALSGVNIVEK